MNNFITLGREICSNPAIASSREWLVTNGIGGYAAGTINNICTRRYHGLLIAATQPPTGRTLLLAKLDETANYQGKSYPLYSNYWADGVIDPHGYKYLESFRLEDNMPVWRFACGSALIEKRIWMAQGENTTYVQYHLIRANQPVTLEIKALVNCRDHHHLSTTSNSYGEISKLPDGVMITAFPQANPLYLLTDAPTTARVFTFHPHDHWYYGFNLPKEAERGLDYIENYLHAVTFDLTVEPGRSLTVVASTVEKPLIDGTQALRQQRHYQQALLQKFPEQKTAPDWIQQLVMSADHFIVDRPIPGEATGKTIMAGYPWFTDWGRDTMISLPGLTITTGRYDIARSILKTFAQYIDQGMLPNCFPDIGNKPYYNTVDAPLWYFVAVRAYYLATGDQVLLKEILPVLAEIILWYKKGTRYNIQLDPHDGLIYAGTLGSQLTWMDAKVGDWVVTPRIGKPIEISALWYHALQTMILLTDQLGQKNNDYHKFADLTYKGFQRFWQPDQGYCFDVLDTPTGNDATSRPNQILAVSLPVGDRSPYQSLLTPEQAKSIVDHCSNFLLTSYGLRSLNPQHSEYKGVYQGNLIQRDGSYHQGTAWGWLLGSLAIADWQVYQDQERANSILTPMAEHLAAYGVGTLGEIFDGDEPFLPRGCIAQAWTVAEVLRAWSLINLGNRE
jgi:predicted glycogen debranching enzyme